jgi:hypothetical protein
MSAFEVSMWGEKLRLISFDVTVASFGGMSTIVLINDASYQTTIVEVSLVVVVAAPSGLNLDTQLHT